MLIANASFFSPTAPADTVPKLLLQMKTPSKNERWNQAKFGYLDPYFNKAYGDGEVLLIRKEVYYRNMILFVQQIQSLVTFWGAGLVKTNIATLSCDSALAWYISKLSDFDRNTLNNDLSMKN